MSLAIIAATIAGLTLLGSQGHQTQTESNSFIEEPVVDILIPALFRETSTGGINAPLNVSRGQSVSLTVQLYPTTSLNVSMLFRYFILGGLNNNQTSTNQNSSQYLSAKFDPQILTIEAGKTVNTTMRLEISQAATKGQYNSVVSAVNLQNSSQIWGVIIQINIQ